MTQGNYDPRDPRGFSPGPQPGGFPPQQGGYPPPQGGYPPQPGGYSPGPQQGGYPPGLPGGAVPGDLWIRFGARIIDGILLGIVVSLVLFGFGLYDNTWLPGLFSGILVFAYYVGFEVSQGWTPGKKILGLRVLGAHGAPKPTVQESAIRNSFLLLSIIPFVGGILALIAYIVIAVTINSSPTKQGKHDQLAGGTQVVKG